MSDTIEALTKRVKAAIETHASGPADGALLIEVEHVLEALREPYQLPREKGWYLDKDDNPIHVDGDRYTRPGAHSYNDFHYRDFAPFRRLVLAEESGS